MKTIVHATLLLGGAILFPTIAEAQCEGVSIVPDGRIRVIDATDYAWFSTYPGRSYSIEVTTPDGVTGVTPFAPVLNTADNCPTATSGTGFVSTTQVEPRLGQGARWSYTNSTNLFVTLRMRVGGQAFRVSASETTLFNSSWSTVGGFATQWGFQNTTGTNLTGTLKIQESFGGTATYSVSVSLPAERTTFVTTFDQFGGATIPAGRGGSATFTHSGPPGSVQGDAYLVNGTQIIPALFRAMRESAH